MKLITFIGSCQQEDMATFSFHPVKQLRWEKVVRLLPITEPMPSKCVVCAAAPSQNLEAALVYDIAQLGYNYRASDINCALGISQLKKLNHLLKNDEVCALCDEFVKPLAPILQGPQRVSYCNQLGIYMPYALILHHLANPARL